MNKKLLAAALGVAFAAPVFADSSSLTLYGRVHTVINHADSDNGAGQSATMQDVSSRIGIDVKEDLGGGLKLIAGYEFGVQNSNQTSAGGGINSGRNGTIGFDGSFGKVQFGAQDGGRGTEAPMYNMGQGFVGGLSNNGGPQAQVSGSSVGALNATGGVTASTTVITGSQRVGNSVGYSVNVSGLAINVRHSNVGTDNAPTGAAREIGQRETEISLGYKIAGFNLGFAAFNADQSSNAPTNRVENSYLLGGSYDIGALNLALVYQHNKLDVAAGDDKDNNYAVSATYKLGGGSSIYGMYGDGERLTTDLRQMQLMYAYDFSKRTRTYVGIKRLNVDTGATDVDLDNITVGLRHNF